MKRVNTTEDLLILLVVLSSTVAAAYLFLSYTRIPVNPDAGYYIPISKEVMEGATPTVEVKTSYTPGIYYVYALWFNLLGTDYSTTVLLVYLVNVLNCVLLYRILSSFVEHTALRVIICFSYYYTIMLTEGYDIVLEPFQVLFTLLAYLAYLKNYKILSKHALVGFCLGCSIMFKQYSLFVFIGFLMTFWFDFRKSEQAILLWKRILITCIFSSIPFFIFVLFTKANLSDSLYSFGFLNRSPLVYATRGQLDSIKLMSAALTRTVQMNWLFAPFLLYVYFALFHKDYLRPNKTVMPIFFASSLPIIIRQYGHYFQLIAPWSFIILGILTNAAMRHFLKDKKMINYLIVCIAFCLFIILPLFIILTPSFYSVSKAYIAVITLLFLSTVIFTVSRGMYLSRCTINPGMIVFALASVIFFETLFLSLKLPFNNMELLKNSQREEAVKINKFFPQGSSVFVIDYPELYVTCNFRNPLHEFTFLDKYNAPEKLKTIDLDKIENIIIRKDSPFLSLKRLNELGYGEIGGTSQLKVTLFEKVRTISQKPGMKSEG